jgi:outer membrane protein OmpA-like peptidoglycan-associated protein
MQRWFLAAIALAMLAGCSKQQEMYVVLPNADGRPGSGAIAVDNGKTTVALDQPYAAGEARQGNDAAIDVPSSTTYVIFNQASSARPVLPHRFRLHFELGSDELTPESEADYSRILADIRSRRAYEVQVVGYTDTLGGEGYNQQLSLSRAEAVCGKLVSDGVTVSGISIDGRGKLDPLVPTGDQVAEPENRRAEILVR